MLLNHVYDSAGARGYSRSRSSAITRQRQFRHVKAAASARVGVCRSVWRWDVSLCVTTVPAPCPVAMR